MGAFFEFVGLIVVGIFILGIIVAIFSPSSPESSDEDSDSISSQGKSAWDRGAENWEKTKSAFSSGDEVEASSENSDSIIEQGKKMKDWAEKGYKIGKWWG